MDANYIEYYDNTSIKERKPANPSIQDGAYIQYVMEKAYESDKRSAWIQL